MLAKDVADRPAAMQTVQKISGGVKRLDALVGQVLQFTREVVTTPQQFDLTAAWSHSPWSLPQKCFEDRHVFASVEGPQSLPVLADPLLIGQVILNLLLNAAEAMQDGGIVTVRFGPVIATEGRPILAQRFR